MKIERCSENQGNFQILNDLTRCLKIYFAFKYIYQHHECTINEVLENADICKSTLYDYIGKAESRKLIIKNSDKKINKNGARFIVIARPKLSLFLIRFKTIIFEFFGTKLEDHDNL